MTCYQGMSAYSLLFIGLVLLALFAESYYKYNLIQSISYQPADQPWLPPSVGGSAIVGNHYFGDFQLPYFFIKDANPYLPNNLFNNILPLGQLTFEFFRIFTLKAATCLFLIISIAIYAMAIFRLLSISKNLSITDRTIISLMIVGFNAPVISAIDRGAPVLIVCGIVAMMIPGIIKNSFSKSEIWRYSFFLSWAMSAKIYLIPFVLLLFWITNRKIVYYSTSLFLFLNLICSFLFGGVAPVARQLYSSLHAFSGVNNVALLQNSISFTGGLEQIIQRFFHHQNLILFIAKIGFFPGLVLMGVLYFSAYRSYVDKHYVLIIGFSMFQYISPVSYAYTAVWAGAALAMLIAFYTQEEINLYDRASLPLVIGVMSQMIPTLLPTIYRWATPVLWFASLIMFYYVISRINKKDKRNYKTI